MKYLTSVIMGCLIVVGALSMIANTAEQAEAMSAVTFTTKATATASSTTQFQRVFENGTVSVIMLDGNSSGYMKQNTYSLLSETVSTTTSGLIYENSTTLLLSPTASAASSTDATGVTWYTQSNGITSREMYAASRTGIAQKVSTTGSPMYDRPVNSVDIWVCEDGSAPGAARVGVFTTTMSEIFLITTFSSTPPDCDTNDPLQMTFSKTAGTGYHIMQTGQRLGVVYNHTSSSTTQGYDIELSVADEDTTATIYSDSIANAAWVDDSTDDMKLIARYLPHVTDADDSDSRSFWRNNVNSESGAYICYDQTTSRYTTGVKVNFPDATEIPQTLDVLIGSACNTGTDVGNWNTINSAGDQSFNFTGAFGRFVTLKVNTWGSDVRFRVGEGQTFISPHINTLAVAGNVDEQGKYTFVSGRDSASSRVGVAKLSLAGLGQTGTNIFGSTSMTSIKDVAQSTTNVYVLGRDGSSNLWLGIANRALSTYSEVQIVTGTVTDNVARLAIYEGTPDTVYAVYHTAGGLKIVKYTSTPAVNGATLTHTAGDFSIAQLSNKVVVQTSSNLYELDTGTDTVTLVIARTALTKLPQTFTISASARTYSANPIYTANSTIAYSYVPTTGVGTRTGIIVNATNAGTGALTTYGAVKYYHLTGNNLIIDSPSAASTTWTIKDLGIQNQLHVTAYSEKVGVPLLQNDTLFGMDVGRLLCDAQYKINHIKFKYFSIGDDSDCSGWMMLATSSATVGREITTPYVREIDLVHNDIFTAYSIVLDSPNPSSFFITSSYEGTAVDTGIADLGGQAQQRYVYGQCYDVTIESIASGANATIGIICANDFFTKTIKVNDLVLGAVIPEGELWYIKEGQRNFTNPVNNVWPITFDNVERPWNLTIFFTDHFLQNDRTFGVWYNLTNKNGLYTLDVNSTVLQRPFRSNMTIHAYMYDDDGNQVDPRTSVGIDGPGLTNPFASLGNFAGVPLGIVAVVLVAMLWTSKDVYIGIIVTAAVAGLMMYFGFIPIAIDSPSFWGAIMVFVALGILSAKRTFG